MLKNKKVIGKENYLSKFVTAYSALVIAGLPLVLTNGFYNVTETKAIFYFALSCFLIFVSFCFFLCRQIKGKRQSNKGNYNLLDFSIAFYAIFSLVSAVLSQYPADAWIGEKSRYQGAVTILLYCVIYFIVSRNYSKSQAFLFSALIAFVIVSVIGVLNCFDIDVLGFYSDLSQSQKKIYISTIGNVNFYSSYICLLLPLVIAGFCQTKKFFSQLIYTIALVVGTFGMMVTSSESFVVGFAGAMLIMPFFFFRNIDRIKKFLISTVIIVLSAQAYNLIYNMAETKNVEISLLLSVLLKPLVSGVLIAVCVLMYFVLKNRPKKLRTVKITYTTLVLLIFSGVIVCFVLANTKDIPALNKYFRISEDWGTYRGEIWSQCVEAFKGFSLKEKLFGIGPEAVYHLTNTSEVFDSRVIDQAHNEYLQHLLTVGIAGLVSYVSIFVTALIMLIRKLKDNALAVGLFAGLASYWIQAIVNIGQPFTTPIMFLYLAYLGGMSYNTQKK